MAPEMQSFTSDRKWLYGISISQSGWYLPGCYFLRLFFWFAAIFSFTVSGVAFAGVTFPSVPAGGVPGRFSTFRPLPFLFPSSLMREYLQAGRIIASCRKSAHKCSACQVHPVARPSLYGRTPGILQHSLQVYLRRFGMMLCSPEPAKGDISGIGDGFLYILQNLPYHWLAWLQHHGKRHGR